MSFSQSFSIDESILNQLDGCEKKCSNNNNKQFVKPYHDQSVSLTGRNNLASHAIEIVSPVANNRTDEGKRSRALDVIDESPTEKQHVLGESIKERLRNVSTSKKKISRHMRRSKSDPLTKNGPNNDTKSSGDSLDDDLDSIFDSSISYMANSKQESKSKTQGERNDNWLFDDDDFEKCVKDIASQFESPKTSTNRRTNDVRKKQPTVDQLDVDAEMFESKFSMEIRDCDSYNKENIADRNIDNTSRGNNESLAVFSSEDWVALCTDIESQEIEPKATAVSFQWEESVLFDDILVSQRNDIDLANLIQAEERLIEDEVPDSDKNTSIIVADEMESHLLDISAELSKINDSTASSLKRCLSPLNNSSLLFNSSKRIKLANISIEENNHSSHNVPIGTSRLDVQNLATLGCSKAIIKEYSKKGIQKIFDWQADCLSKPNVTGGKRNFVYSAPTSAGKTFVSEILMIHTVLKRKKKVLIILPFVSVVREKMYYMQDLLRASGIRVEGFFGGYSAAGGFDSVDVAVCTIEKANSIVNKLLEQQKIDSIGLIVVDEIHLISDSNRGYILELLLAKVLYCSKKLNANIQIVAMSATLPNSELLINWLNAEFYQTNYRPVALQEMIKIGNSVYNNEMSLVRSIDTGEYSVLESDQDNISQLCVETIVDGSAVIVFCPSKDWCEKLALHVAIAIYRLGKSKSTIGEKLRQEIDMKLIEEVKAHLRNSPTGIDDDLSKTISYGVAFHHAGLTFDERDIIESAFSNRLIRVIVATSTLSSGVNLPAGRVIIRTPLFGGKPMSSLTYKQMIGRAGRMGKSAHGESILICTEANARIGKELIGATMKPLTSCLDCDDYSHLKRAILEIIASGMVTTRQELETFIKSTLFYSEHNFNIRYFDEDPLEQYAKQSRSGQRSKTPNECGDLDIIGKCMQFLEHYEFIRLHFDDDTREIKYVSTRLGHACLASSTSPADGFILFSELQKARQSFVLETGLHAVYLVTPFSVCYQLKEIDWLIFLDLWEKLSVSMQRVGELVGVKESFLVKAMRGNNKLDQRSLEIHKRFYTALALNELINECSLNDVAAKFKLTRGTLQSLQQSASAFAGIVKSFCNALNWELLGLIISQLQDRIFFGVHQDLIELMKIPILNAQRARALFDSGYHSLIDLSTANLVAIEKCLFDSISFDVEKRDGETNFDAEQRNKSRLLFVTGRSGLSVKEAAKMIIEEARKYLQNEMGLANIEWSQKNSETNENELVDDDNRNSNEENVDSDSRHQSDFPKTKSPERKQQLKEAMPKNNENQVDTDSECSTDSEMNRNKSAHSIYNDEYDDFLPSKEVALDKNTQTIDLERKLASTCQLRIDDVTKDRQTFDHFIKSFENVTECGFALAVAKQQNNNDNTRCKISEGFFICGLSLCFHANIAHYISLQDDTDAAIRFDKKIEFFESILKRKNLTLKVYDAKSQLRTILKVLPNVLQVACSIKDPKVAQWLLQPEAENNFHKMVSLFAPELHELSNRISQGKINSLTTPKIRASIKSCITRRILHKQMEELKKSGDGSILNTFNDIEMPIQKTLLHMETVGMALNKRAMEKLSEELSDYIELVEKELYRLNGKRFAINSTKTVAQILKIRKKNGGISSRCRRADLEQSDQPMAKLILEYRKLLAIQRNSVLPLLEKIVNNRIYGSSFSFTQTGRISMYEPNLQNVAKDFIAEFPSDSKTFSCRSAFRASSGRIFVSADFCQLELRILAHLSRDKTLISIFSSMQDVFRSIAARWNKVPEDEVTEQMRNNAKQICYGIIYGMGIKSLAATLKCDVEQAEILHESFHKTYPGIRNYTARVLDLARENGYVETFSGRRRYLPDMNAANKPQKKAAAERQAINTTIQGSAADIAKYAMLRMERNLRKYQAALQTNDSMHNVDLVLHLHDELLYEVPISRISSVIKILRSSMEKCAQLLVPLKVKVKRGTSWGQMETVD